LEALGSLPTEQRRYPSREEYAARHGADPQDLKKVEQFAQAHGLAVKEVRVGERSVVLAGTARAMNEAFGVALSRYETESGSYRGTTGPVHVPVDMASVIEAVVGLDSRPYVKPLD
jgi:kumamolisin